MSRGLIMNKQQILSRCPWQSSYYLKQSSIVTSRQQIGCDRILTETPDWV
jgi:hypothetical protein